MRRYELSLSEIITAACRMAIKNMKYIVPIYIVVFAPVYVIMELLPSELFQKILNQDFIASGEFMTYTPYLLVLALSSVVFAPLSTSAVLYLTRKTLANEKPAVSEILDATFGKWHKLALTSFLVQSSIVAGAIFIVPAVYLSVALVFATIVTAATSQFGVGALKASMMIVKGRFFNTLLYSVGIFIFAYVLSGLVSSFLSIIGMNTGSLSVVSQILTEVVSSVSVFATCVWYFSVTDKKPKTNGANGE